MNRLQENWHLIVIFILGIIVCIASYALWVKIEAINNDILRINASVDANSMAIQNRLTKKMHEVPFKPKTALKYQTWMKARQ